MKNKVTHFEIGAEDPEKLSDFYRKALGWEINKWEGSDYWMVGTEKDRSIGAINGGIMKRYENYQTINTIETEDIDTTIGTVVKNGGKIIKPKAAMAGFMWWAYLADPEENIFGVMQYDKDAK